jgi:hypothetical protein
VRVLCSLVLTTHDGRTHTKLSNFEFCPITLCFSALTGVDTPCTASSGTHHERITCGHVPRKQHLQATCDHTVPLHPEDIE